MPLLKSRAGLDVLFAPTVQSSLGAICMTCGRRADEEGLVEGYPGQTTYAKYLVKHHGAEELRTFDMGSTNWDVADAAQMARHMNWFDPTRHEGLGLGTEITPKEMHGEDPEAKKIIVGGG